MKNKKELRKEFKKKVIEAIEENKKGNYESCKVITIGRVLQALSNHIEKEAKNKDLDNLFLFFEGYGGKISVIKTRYGYDCTFAINGVESKSNRFLNQVLVITLIEGIQLEILDLWKIIKENGQEATDDDQDNKTIKKLLNFFEDVNKECQYFSWG